MAATSKKCSEATFKWSGRGGVVKKKFLDHTTPSARAEVASQLFLDRAATPPPAEEGTRLEPVPRLGLRSDVGEGRATI